MCSDAVAPSPLDFVRQVERYYAALMADAAAEHALGGCLLYAGALDASARALLAASNIAGAASLASAPDAEAQRDAVRAGIADFLVTSLDEVLRILKNEIRKHTTVSVCVSVAAAELEREMRERGVAPDLVAVGAAELFAGTRAIALLPVHEPQVRLEWQVASAPALWMPKLDELARACVPAEDAAAHRWLRLAPRYCGRAAAGMRAVRCSRAVAGDFSERVRAAAESGALAVTVEVRTVTD